MSDPSFESASTGTPLTKLTPDAYDTYDWPTVAAARKGAKKLSATAGSTLPSFIQKNHTHTDDNGTQTSGFKLEASPKWFSIVSSELNDQGQVVVALGVQAGKPPPAGKVMRVGTWYSGAGMPGSGRIREYYYEVK